MKNNTHKEIVEVGFWKMFRFFPCVITIYKITNHLGETYYTSDSGGNEKSLDALKDKLSAVYNVVEWSPYKRATSSYGFLAFIFILCVLVNVAFHFYLKSSIGEAFLMSLGSIFIVGYVIWRNKL